MNYTVELSLKARQELTKASEWYDEKLDGLGEEFELEFFRKTDLIQSNPLHYPLKGRYRETLTERFPYLIVYKIILFECFFRNPLKYILNALTD